MVDLIVHILVATVAAGTPLVLAGLGELVAERSGILNLGVEGMMLVGAISAFAVAAQTGSSWLGIGVGLLAGTGMALVFAFLTITLVANQVASGLALTIFGVGLSAFVGRSYSGEALLADWSIRIPGLSDIDIVGPLIFTYDPLVYISWLLFGAVVWFLYRRRAGLVLRAVGESPAAALALGYPVRTIRYLATLFGGAMAGLAGAYLAIVHAQLWLENMTAGRGWIAVALVVFATWRPGRLMVGAYLFGGVTVIQFFAQGAGVELPTEALSALPYLATVGALVLISRNAATARRDSPQSLGKPFHPSI